MPEFSEKLQAPDGRVFTARSASEYNDLRYGQGYRPVANEQDATPPETPKSPASRPSFRSAAPKSGSSETTD